MSCISLACRYKNIVNILNHTLFSIIHHIGDFDSIGGIVPLAAKSSSSGSIGSPVIGSNAQLTIPCFKASSRTSPRTAAGPFKNRSKNSSKLSFSHCLTYLTNRLRGLAQIDLQDRATNHLLMVRVLHRDGIHP